MIRTAGLEGRESPSPPPEQQTCRAEWLQCGPAGVGRLARLAPGRGKVVDGLHGVLVPESPPLSELQFLFLRISRWGHKARKDA